MANADSRLIEWLFRESGITRYRISKDVGISESTLSRIANGETPMDAVRFGYARRLTDYARVIQSARSEGETGSEAESASTSTSTSNGGDNE